MEPTNSDRNVGASIPIPSIVALLVALAVIVGGTATYRTVAGDDNRQELVIATGPESGTYHLLGLALGRLLEAHGVVESVTVIPTDGSVASMQLISAEGGSADLAFVQSNAPAHGHARLLEPLL